MAYQLPVFNLVGNIWRNANPVSNPPDVVSLCNLCIGRRGYQSVRGTPLFSTDRASMYALWPAGTDIRDNFSSTGFDRAEIPAESGRLYTVMWVDDAGGGFANEHRVCQLVKDTTWPTPFPSPGAFATLPLGTPIQNWDTRVTYPSHNPFSAPAGKMIIAATDIFSSGTPSTIAVTGLGILVPVYDSRYTVAPGVVWGTMFYSFTWPGGIGAVDVVVTAPAAVTGWLLAVPLNTLDTSGQRISAGATIYTQSDAPSSGVQELAIEVFNGLGTSRPFTLDIPWVPGLLGSFPGLWGPSSYMTVFAQKIQPTIGIVDGLCVPTGGVPGNVGDVAVFKA